MKLEKTTDVNTIDQYIAVMDFLSGLGYDTSKLTVKDAADIKRNMLNVVEVFNASQE